ncbi:hypothetical protein [Lentzea kentuckyensis]|uniref:hypothetical protein n=1 Tax=Lentzea kentuckyensis TaxID=360086 RepID=UPI001B801E76|nr:hypothetical protein [Lentzea kentuckyensis]
MSAQGWCPAAEPLPQQEFLRPLLETTVDDPAVLADTLWHLHTHPGQFRIFAEDLPAEA